MQHVLHLTVVLSPWFGRFFGALEGSKQCCWPATGQQQTNACVVTLGCLVQDLKDSMILGGSFQLRIVYDRMILSLSSQVFCWVSNISLHGQRKQGPIQHFVAAWCYCLTRIYQRGVLVLSCRSFFFYSFSTFCLWVCWDEIATHLPDLKHGRSKMKRNLDFMGL